MIKRLWFWLTGACQHKWGHQETLTIKHGSGRSIVGYEYHERCTVCGKARVVTSVARC